jgi:hypothetical protein
MMKASDFSPRDFFQLAKEAAEHEAEIKVRLAKAGVIDSREPPPSDQTSSTSRP